MYSSSFPEKMNFLFSVPVFKKKINLRAVENEKIIMNTTTKNGKEGL